MALAFPLNPTIGQVVQNGLQKWVWGGFRWTAFTTGATITVKDLSNVDNTSDLNKPISTATQTALNLKADLVDGKVPLIQLPAFSGGVAEYDTITQFPASGSPGILYLDKEHNELYRWNSTQFVGIAVNPIIRSDTPPTDTSKFWFNTLDATLAVYHINAWLVISSSEGNGLNNTVYSDTPPELAGDGMFWFSTLDSSLYIYYGSAWINLTSGSVEGQSISNTIFSDVVPAVAIDRMFWFNTVDLSLSIYFNNAWITLSGTDNNGSGLENTIYSDTAPTTAVEKMYWFNTLDFTLSIYYSGTWVLLTNSDNSGSGIVNTIFSDTQPTNPAEQTFWFDNINKTLNVFIGGLWINLTANGVVGTSLGLAPELKNLLVYYGYPISYKGYNDVQKVIDEISTIYKYWVVGDQYQEPIHESYSNTQAIITGVKAKGVKVFGYVPIGQSTSNRTLAVMQTAVDQWQTLGVDGIFLDEFGFDYGNTRTRQKAMVDYAHSKNLPIIANAWTFEDFVCDNVSELTWPSNDWRYVNFVTQNPTNLALTRWTNDVYLIENFCYSNTAPSDKFLSQERFQSIKALNATKHVEIWALAVLPESSPGVINTSLTGNLKSLTEITHYCSANAFLYDFDVLGIGGYSFGSSGYPLTVVPSHLPLYAKAPTVDTVSDFTNGIFTRRFGNCSLVVNNNTSQSSLMKYKSVELPSTSFDTDGSLIVPVLDLSGSNSTMLAKDLVNKSIYIQTGSATLTHTTDTAVNIINAIGSNRIGLTTDFNVINSGSGTITVGLGAGVTSVGSMVVAANTSARFKLRITGSSTVSIMKL